jgi:hypothetical protein
MKMLTPAIKYLRFRVVVTGDKLSSVSLTPSINTNLRIYP